MTEVMERGMERNVDQIAGGSLVSGAGASLPQGARPRAFVRMDTNEEYERVKRKKRDLANGGGIGRDAATDGG